MLKENDLLDMEVRNEITVKHQMNTADLLIKCLEEEGVEYIFGIPGEETLDLMNSIKNSKQIRFITTR
ncbi:MAG TPA: thiamine pyrophosphate-binding protein, partial [Anaerovoracaceae bacterium]|nr:thiamine pyrophosphate-binding protein [Anaerovoracaceae bacterium]